MKKNWSKLDRVWFILALLLVLLSILVKDIVVGSEFNFLNLTSEFSAIFGVIYVICIARQEKIAYLFGIANVMLYAFVVYSKGLYLSAGYNLFYCMPVMIYGYIHWSRVESKENSGIKSFSVKQRIVGVIFIILAILIFGLISKKLLNGNNVWLDSTVSVLVCVATFLMARKHIEQWILFIISNFVGIVLFLPTSFNDIINIDLFVMWIVYFINSIYGMVLWKRSLKEERA